MVTEKQFHPCAFEYWGGIECTVNRVKDDFFDQLAFTGHYRRDNDIERIASLGIRKMRYPVLWESHQPDLHEAIDWHRTASRLDRLRTLGVEPIAGLLHHGSGPVFTDLTDPDFASKFARYASAVAKRFPWIRYYTPVNEPLTTARFSGLYGLWYPHKRDNLSFVRMLFNQVRATVLAMREIRMVNPEAMLIQTEDLSKTHANPMLAYQAEFENERRWLTMDLLCGKVNREHYLWQYLRRLGVTEREILFFEENPCPPDLVGYNYYLTSERFLDDEVDYYPEHLHGGNGIDRYVDTEAIRLDHPGESGLSILLKEAWDRHRLPIAITEAFLSCTQDEQVRWLYDVCRECSAARAHGVDIRAITFWALLGEFGWNKLVTSLDGEYEPGAFDVRHPVPMETLTASFIREITSSRLFNKRWLESKGWWRDESRFHVRNQCATG